VPRKLSRMQRLVAGIGGALCAFAAVPGAALAAECPVPTTAPVFAEFGDHNQYVLAPGGDFEGPLNWLKFGRVELEHVNDPFELAPGHHSLELDRSGEMVTSTSFCVDRTMPHMRFVAKGYGQLDVIVSVNYQGSSDSSSGSISPDDHRTWQPSRFVNLKTSSIPAGESATAKVTFKSNGSWLIDNLFLDPYRR
jgi:hypothetical protein